MCSQNVTRGVKSKQFLPDTLATSFYPILNMATLLVIAMVRPMSRPVAEG